MNVSSSGATLSLAIDTRSVADVLARITDLGIQVTEGEVYTSQRRGTRQTLFMPTAAFESVEKVLLSSGYDVRRGPLTDSGLGLV